MALEGVYAVVIRRPKRADPAHTAEIILKHMRSWPTQCSSVPTIISFNLRTSRPRLVSTIPHFVRKERELSD
jgi:hypothetical protein